MRSPMEVPRWGTAAPQVLCSFQRRLPARNGCQSHQQLFLLTIGNSDRLAVEFKLVRTASQIDSVLAFFNVDRPAVLRVSDVHSVGTAEFDRNAVARDIVGYLTGHGYDVEHVDDGEKAYAPARRARVAKQRSEKS